MFQLILKIYQYLWIKYIKYHKFYTDLQFLFDPYNQFSNIKGRKNLCHIYSMTKLKLKLNHDKP